MKDPGETTWRPWRSLAVVLAVYIPHTSVPRTKACVLLISNYKRHRSAMFEWLLLGNIDVVWLVV